MPSVGGGRRAESPRVLCLVGRGRSGSTIFANVLGGAEDWFSAGEVRFLWDPVVLKDGPCACGEPVTRCEVWSEVLDELNDVDPSRAAVLQRNVVKERNLPRLLRYPMDGSWASVEEYAAIMQRVYEAVKRVTGCRVIVDSSKRPSYAAFLRLIDDCRPYFVHLVRDPRASAYSWRHRRHESVQGKDVEVRRRNVLDSTLRWNLLNLEAEMLLQSVGRQRALTLRYEDFVTAPRAAVNRIGEFVGNSTSWPFVDERTLDLGANHVLAGNPSRFTTGRIVVRDTDEWRRQQSRSDRWLATAMAVPFLRRYGYPVVGRSAHRRRG